MVADKKGGLNSYKVIKDEITDMIGNLSAGTLFNVMLHDGWRTMLFKPQLSSAGSAFSNLAMAISIADIDLAAV